MEAGKSVGPSGLGLLSGPEGSASTAWGVPHTSRGTAGWIQTLAKDTPLCRGLLVYSYMHVCVCVCVFFYYAHVGSTIYHWCTVCLLAASLIHYWDKQAQWWINKRCLCIVCVWWTCTRTQAGTHAHTQAGTHTQNTYTGTHFFIVVLVNVYIYIYITHKQTCKQGER